MIHNSSSVPDHSIEKLGLKPSGVRKHWRKKLCFQSIPSNNQDWNRTKPFLPCKPKYLPKHSIKQLGLKQRSNSFLICSLRTSRAFHQTTRIETFCFLLQTIAGPTSRAFHQTTRIETSERLSFSRINVAFQSIPSNNQD